MKSSSINFSDSDTDTDAAALMKMQTNFSLKTGETLILSNENGDILGKVAIIDCDENESLVRQRDGSYAKGTPTFEKNNT